MESPAAASDGRSTEKKFGNAVWQSVWPPALFTALCWLIQLAHPSDFGLGILPRTAEGFTGVISSPLVHADYDHLWANTLPLLIIGALIFYFYRVLAVRTIILIWLMSGIWTWLIGRESWHVGASGLIYGGASFLFFSGLLRRHGPLMAVSLLVVFLYGGMIWGIFPIHPAQSWEAHLSGAVAGLFLALYYRHEGPQRPVYEWEEEIEEEETPAQPGITITYTVVDDKTHSPDSSGD